MTINGYDITKYINQNQNVCIDWVLEFFDGKYTREEVRYRMYESNEEKSARNSIVLLAEEFRQLENKKQESLTKWYETTDNYIFDLLPWNGAEQFQNKLSFIESCIRGDAVIADFGSGLGVSSIFYASFVDKVYSIDLKDSVTHKFAQFLVKKLNITNVEFMGTEEFFDSNIIVDSVVSLDCFEHILDLETVLYNLAQHTNRIIHDSEFQSDQHSPQHVFTNFNQFMDIMASFNFMPQEGTSRVFNRVVFHWVPKNGKLTLTHRVIR